MKISVIIPALNSRATLQEALDSVLKQTHRDFEIIVMDGGSKDGTVELLRQYDKSLKHWQSAQDQGTTHAINDGLHYATGELTLILCSDDLVYSPQTFRDILVEFKKNPDIQVLCNTLEMFDRTGFIAPYLNPSDKRFIRRRGSLHLPGAFFRTETLKRRPFSYDVDVANDYEYFAHLMTTQPDTIKVTDLITVRMSLGGRMNALTNERRKIRECFIVRRKHFGFLNSWTWFLWDSTIATLRRYHFRPFTWWRKWKQIGSPSAKVAK